MPWSTACTTGAAIVVQIDRHPAFAGRRELDLERGAAQAYIERYFARYPGVARYMATTREAARTQGYVETVFGRRL